MHYSDALQARVQKTSPICVGLDPNLFLLPEGIARNSAGVRDFCFGIVDAVADVAACIKPQMAFFEVLGWEGMKVFWEVCAYAKEKGMIVIADGKRGDIGSTCEAYADAYLGEESPIDALTVNPFFGSDGILPFLARCSKNGKGIYIMVKNSNPSSGEIQDLPVGDHVVHEHLATLVQGWGESCVGEVSRMSCLGAVVGATYPEELTYLRTLMPFTPLLIPGYGAQGGKAEDVKRGFYEGGLGAIVNSSRAIIFASKGANWQTAARAEAEKMAAELRAVLSTGMA